MISGTFGLTGAGTLADPVTVDWTTGPSGPLGYVPVAWGTTSQTPTTITVRYQTQ